ncbi:prophage maintenance system killer protein [Streptococcus pneumoniae]|nr:prophage maintenance system killer protein [Streptococcus pneumoniae]
MTIYLTEKQIEKINALAIQRYSPNEKIQTVSSSALNMIVNLPEQFVFGKSLYPTIFDKATILFVQLIKKHVFANANIKNCFLRFGQIFTIKRLSFFCNGRRSSKNVCNHRSRSFN